MDFNGSFGEDNNIIIKPIEKGDIAEEQKLQKDLKKNEEFNASFNDSNNNIFSSVPLEMKIDNEYSSNIYDSLLTKELIKYNLSNIFNIVKRKQMSIQTQIYYFLQKTSNSKVNNLVCAEILYIKISSSLSIISKIFKQNRKKKLFQVFYKLKSKNKINDIFKLKFEMMYKKQKDTLINDNNIILRSIEKEIKEIDNRTKSLKLKEADLKLELNNLIKKEKQLNEKIKSLENSKNNNINVMKQQSSNISSINNNSKYDSDIISLESTIETNKQLKEGKEEIIKKFIYKMNDLLNEYKVYIDMLYNNDVINNHLHNGSSEINDNSNSNQQSLSHKDKDGSGNTWYTSKISSGIQVNNLGNLNFNEH